MTTPLRTSEPPTTCIAARARAPDPSQVRAATPVPTPFRRVAILGGDARQEGRWLELGTPVYFQARRFGGNGELRRLERALRAGTIDHVVILIRWNGHSATEKVRRLCRSRRVPVTLVP